MEALPRTVADRHRRKSSLQGVETVMATSSRNGVVAIAALRSKASSCDASRIAVSGFRTGKLQSTDMGHRRSHSLWDAATKIYLG